jgi:hypothetical protein
VYNINLDMEDEIYLTSNLYIKDKITYYIDDENDKTVRVNKSNWHKYLEDYGWEKINPGWIRRFNKYSNTKSKNSCWGVLDCGGNGDCLFNVIASAIYEPDMQVIRQMAANEITDENFDIIIETYRSLYDAKDFDCLWNPYDINTKEELKEELIKTGHNYWGDHIVLQLLESALNMNFIILNDENEDMKRGKLKDRFKVHNIGGNYNPNNRTIILYYIDSVHFQLVGYFDETYMRTVFDKLPMELLLLYREDCVYDMNDIQF